VGNLAYYYGNKQGWSGEKKVLAIVGAFFGQFVLLFLLAAPLALI
jgi:hypothetical protein